MDLPIRPLLPEEQDEVPPNGFEPEPEEEEGIPVLLENPYGREEE